MSSTKTILDDQDYAKNNPESQYVVFKRFSSKENAEELSKQLTAHEVQNVIDTSALPVSIVPNGQMQNEIVVKVKQSNLRKANLMLQQLMHKNIAQLDTDHYLFEFTEEELIDVIKTPHEWQYDDYLLAQKLLKDRGCAIAEKQLKSFESVNLAREAQEEKAPIFMLYRGYIYAFVIGGMGLIVGLGLLYQRKTISDGRKVNFYDEASRKHGKYIVLISIFTSLVYIFVLYKRFSR